MMKYILTICLGVIFVISISQELNAQNNTSIIKESIRVKVDESPRFPGCEHLEISREEKEACSQKEMLQYIYNNLKYPEVARRNGIEGQVVVQFVVNKEGRFEDVNIVRDLDGGCGDEVLRIVEKMSNMTEAWRPGYQDGLPVKVKYTLPIKFKLEGRKSLWRRIFGI